MGKLSKESLIPISEMEDRIVNKYYSNEVELRLSYYFDYVVIY